MHNAEGVQSKTRFLSVKDVQQITGLSKSTIYRQIKEGLFSKPLVLAARKVGFLQVELEAWIQNRRPSY